MVELILMKQSQKRHKPKKKRSKRRSTTDFKVYSGSNIVTLTYDTINKLMELQEAAARRFRENGQKQLNILSNSGVKRFNQIYLQGLKRGETDFPIHRIWDIPDRSPGRTTRPTRPRKNAPDYP